MGAMNCCRTNCDNIMCDTYVPGVGYVCRECQEDFNRFLNHWHNAPSINQLEFFINRTEKDEYGPGDSSDTQEFFKHYTE